MTAALASDLTKPQSGEQVIYSSQRSARIDIPGYTLLRTLGEGGMGVVWQAIQRKLNRMVAVKMIHYGHSASARELVRFLAEAEAVGAIDHPHVVKVFECGDAGSTPYIAMEYLPGGCLRERLKKPMAPREAAELMVKLAVAVQAAHNVQIVHRDLKPANVLFDAAGEPRVCDFGLAKRGSADLTTTNAVMGTACYMAPEQARGESKFVGPAADVWALGVIFYECLCGERPFSGSSDIEVIQKVVADEPSRLRTRSGSIPPDLERIVEKCLAKNVAQRYPSAKALADDVQCWLEGRPISVKAATPRERLLRWVTRNRTAAVVTGAALTATVAMAGLALKAKRAEAAANDRAELLDTERQRTENTSRALRLANTLAIPDCTVAIEPHSGVCAVIDTAGVEVLDLRNNRAVIRLGDAVGIHCVAFTPDARHLLTGCVGGEVVIRSTEDWSIVRRHQAHQGAVSVMAFSPDGQWIITGGGDNVARIWDAAHGHLLHELRGHTGPITACTINGDSDRIVTGSLDGTAKVWSREGALLFTYAEHRQPLASAVITLRGQTVITVDRTHQMHVWDAFTGEKWGGAHVPNHAK